MITIDEVIDNINNLDYTDNFCNDVICAFEDYEVNGETEVIVSEDESNDNIDFQAYINEVSSDIIMIKIEGKKVKAWN